MTTLQTIMRANGIVADPDLVLAACTKSGLAPSIMCAKLMRESGGGRNVFGSDRVAYPTSGAYTKSTKTVTRAAVQAYLKWRGAGPAAGRGGRQNGVGPSQLTWWTLQDEAERRGGLHLPGPNLDVGAAEFKRLLDKADGDLRAAAGEYNGGIRWREYGAAVEYAEWMVTQSARWQTLLNGSGSTLPATAPGSDLPTLRAGERSENVRRLQAWARTYPWPPAAKIPLVPATGYYGAQTIELVAAIQRYREVTGTDADGTIVGPRTNRSLAVLGYPWESR